MLYDPHLEQDVNDWVRVLEIVNHPNIQTTYDLVQDDTYYYIVQEDITGKTLISLVKET